MLAALVLLCVVGACFGLAFLSEVRRAERDMRATRGRQPISLAVTE